MTPDHIGLTIAVEVADPTDPPAGVGDGWKRFNTNLPRPIHEEHAVASGRVIPDQEIRPAVAVEVGDGIDARARVEDRWQRGGSNPGGAAEVPDGVRARQAIAEFSVVVE